MQGPEAPTWSRVLSPHSVPKNTEVGTLPLSDRDPIVKTLGSSFMNRCFLGTVYHFIVANEEQRKLLEPLETSWSVPELTLSSFKTLAVNFRHMVPEQVQTHTSYSQEDLWKASGDQWEKLECKNPLPHQSCPPNKYQGSRYQNRIAGQVYLNSDFKDAVIIFFVEYEHSTSIWKPTFTYDRNNVKSLIMIKAIMNFIVS